jgi:hypothetical protein
LTKGSEHSRTRVGEDGSTIELWTFEECLPHHIRFVEWCVRDWQPLHRGRSKSLKAYVQGLAPAAGLPHYRTCIKVLKIIRALITRKLKKVIKKHAALHGDPHSGAQDDIWSMQSCRESIFCMRLSMQARRRNPITRAAAHAPPHRARRCTARVVAPTH